MSDSLTFYFPYLIKQLSFVILIKSGWVGVLIHDHFSSPKVCTEQIFQF